MYGGTLWQNASRLIYVLGVGIKPVFIARDNVDRVYN